MNILFNIIISTIITALTFVGAYKYLPLSYLETPTQKFGTTIITIAGSDTLSSSRTTINNNFSALNTGKIEISTTTLPLITTLAGLTTANALTSASSLATIGTITSGIWNGTAVPVTNGGTGSTTLSSNQVLLGNGTSLMKTVSGYGTTGQFLTSNGGVAAPTWQTSAVDTAIDYTWTGLHNFTSTTTTKGLVASSTAAAPLTLNGISFNTPSTQGASSTALINDASGNLKWYTIYMALTYAAGDSLLISSEDEHSSSAGGGATTTVKEILMNGSGTVTVIYTMSCGSANPCSSGIYKNNVAVGTYRYMTVTSPSTFTENISGIVVGDLLQIKAKSITADAIVSNLKIRINRGYDGSVVTVK